MLNRVGESMQRPVSNLFDSDQRNIQLISLSIIIVFT